ncbi:MAG: hypothetical protein J6O43_00975 [Clostridium sp.]|nr:hypothetical protein [Clostridium sp.]
MPVAAYLKQELEKAEQQRRRKKDKNRAGTAGQTMNAAKRAHAVSNEGAGDLIRSGLIPSASNEHLRGLHGDNNGAFGTYLADPVRETGSEVVHEKLDKGTYTVQGNGDRAAFTPAHYASYLQIWGSPRKAVEYYTRYLELRDKKKEDDLAPEEVEELDQLERLEKIALEYDDARHYMQEKKAYSQQDIDYAFSQNRHRKDGSKSEMFGTAHSPAAMYQCFFLDGVFGGMKEQYLKGESDGGIPEAAVKALSGGGTPENLEGMKKWLDKYLTDCVRKQRRGMTMIMRGIFRSDPKHTRITFMQQLENILSLVYLRKEFTVTDTDPRMLAADRYMRRALELLMRDPGSGFTKFVRMILERILAEKV